MTVQILLGDVRARLKELPSESVHCVVTSPPYWGLRDYGVVGQLGLEATLGEHLRIMVEDVFAEVWRVLRKDGTCWVNYGDCYATAPNGRSAADTKAAANDDRTFRDKPFSTVGPVYVAGYEKTQRVGVSANGGNVAGAHGGRVVAAGVLKPKDLCMMPNRFAIAMQDWGWWVRSEIIWHKPNPMPESIKDRPGTAHEKVFLFSKSERYWYDAEAVRTDASESSIGRWQQDIEAQQGSLRAHGGERSDRPMKAVRGRDTFGRHTLDDKVPKSERRDARGAYEPSSGLLPPHKGLAAAREVSREKKRALTPRHEGHVNHTQLDATPRGSANLRNVWSIPVAGFKEAHFATFPPALPEICIKAGCPEGGVVLDPFGGAGTTGLVADRLKRDAILIELNPAYAEIARKRIHGDAPLFSAVDYQVGAVR
ncbi:site-specific DNA-methyltransferase [Dongia sp.]|uniref:DNA-methyltransferase n=1 Tax=Dongia sp. TaxID=1977262 RepID=UPI0035AE3515